MIVNEKTGNIFYDETLPKWESGTNKGKIKWQASKDVVVKVLYNNINYWVTILEYYQNNSRVLIKNGKKECDIKIKDFTMCKLNHLLDEDFNVTNGKNIFYCNNLKRDAKGIIWSKNIGEEFDILYSGELYTFKILKYYPKSKKVELSHNGLNCEPIKIDNLLRSQIGGIIGKRTIDFKISIADVFNDKNRNIIIIDKEYRKRKNRNEIQKWYKYKCNKCNNEDWLEESSILTKNTGCNACCTSPQKVTIYNCLATKNPELIKFLINKDDALKVTPFSNTSMICKCPDCGFKKKSTPSRLSTQGFSCSKCGDGIPYTERLMFSVLEYIKINNIIRQYKTEWSEGRIYDFFMIFNGFNVIIETHGRQHYEEIRLNKKMTRTLKEEQENDKFKRELALANGIDYYFEIDCRESTLEWIKNSIILNLSSLLDVSKVDWDCCNKEAQKSKVKEACKLFKIGKLTSEISKELNISQTTTIDYLKRASKLGWCEYNPKEEVLKGRQRAKEMNSKSVNMFKDGEFVYNFSSCREASEKFEVMFGIKLDPSSISKVCNGYKPQYKGYTFKYVE